MVERGQNDENRRKKREKFIYSRVSITCTNFILYVLIYPTIQVFRMSMFKWGGFSNNQQFVGFDNFKILWADENFFRTVQNTILLIVVVTLFTVVLAVLFRGNPFNRKDSETTSSELFSISLTFYQS